MEVGVLEGVEDVLGEDGQGEEVEEMEGVVEAQVKVVEEVWENVGVWSWLSVASFFCGIMPLLT